MSEKKSSDYEKPESHEIEGEDLADVSGGAGSTGTYTCSQGLDAYGACSNGPTPNFRAEGGQG